MILDAIEINIKQTIWVYNLFVIIINKHYINKYE